MYYKETLSQQGLGTSKPRTPRDDHTNSELRHELVVLMDNYDIVQIISEATHYTQGTWNLLDLIVTESPWNIAASGSLPPVGNSHYNVTYCVTKHEERRSVCVTFLLLYTSYKYIFAYFIDHTVMTVGQKNYRFIKPAIYYGLLLPFNGHPLPEYTLSISVVIIHSCM